MQGQGQGQGQVMKGHEVLKREKWRATHVLWVIFHFKVIGDDHFAIWEKIRSGQVKVRSFKVKFQNWYFA